MGKRTNLQNRRDRHSLLFGPVDRDVCVANPQQQGFQSAGSGDWEFEEISGYRSASG